ncbi:MAG: hypothetical protein LBD16_06700 [Oscillospiraceae bacterium]|jgi:hypothetical protein|nr:hypothetical protein [Oscillospiraceae bacterium]
MKKYPAVLLAVLLALASVSYSGLSEAIKENESGDTSFCSNGQHFTTEEVQQALDLFFADLEQRSEVNRELFAQAVRAGDAGQVYTEPGQPFGEISLRALTTRRLIKTTTVVDFLGNSINFQAHAYAQYDPAVNPHRFSACKNAWTDAIGINYVGFSVSSSPRGYTYAIINSGKTLAVTTDTYISIAGAGVVNSSGVFTNYVEFSYTQLSL